MKLVMRASENDILFRRSWSIIILTFLAVSALGLEAPQVFAQGMILLDHTMCLDVNPQTELPLNRTAKFFSTDKHAISWFEIEVREIGPAYFTWHWLDPEGKSYRNTTRAETFTSLGLRRFWDALSIRGRIENVTGKWKVKVHFRARSLFDETFTINPSTYDVTVTAKGLDRRYRTNVYIDNLKQGTLAGSDSQTFILSIGAPHNVSVDSVVYSGNLTRFICGSNWRIATSKAGLVFEFEPQHHLKVRSEYGKIEPNVDGWYRNGSTVTFRVETPIVRSFGIRYVFVSWKGDFSSVSPSALLVMDRPKTIIAVWKEDYTMLYIFVVLMVSVLCGVVFSFWRKGRTEMSPNRPGPTESVLVIRMLLGQWERCLSCRHSGRREHSSGCDRAVSEYDFPKLGIC